jgi:hypothetical protein
MRIPPAVLPLPRNSGTKVGHPSGLGSRITG